MAYLSREGGSEELVKCHDLFFFNKKVFIFLDYMDQGSMDRIVNNFHESYSENFCRYSLYKVALGLSRMHQANILHRDIKSDNILFSSDGQIKICDLGLATFLSQESSQSQS